MGKKRRLIKTNTKFGRKFSNHPILKRLYSEKTMEEPTLPKPTPVVITPEEEKPAIKLEKKVDAAVPVVKTPPVIIKKEIRKQKTQAATKKKKITSKAAKKSKLSRK